MTDKNIFRKIDHKSFLSSPSSIFYISCLGSSASNWINKMLSRHPKIVCLQATRSFPPVWPGFTYPHKNYWYPWITEISPEKFIQSLVLCSKSTHNEKIFGAIHGYHGLLAKEPCEKHGGVFSYITRNPISRIHSVFISGLDKSYYAKFTKINNSEIHKRTCDLLKNEDLIPLVKKIEERKEKKNILLNIINKGAKKILPNSTFEYLKNKKEFYRIKKNSKNEKKILQDEKEVVAEDFIYNVREFLKHDALLYESCSESYGIKMEETVKSADYFKNKLLKRIAPDLEVKDEYLNSVFSEKRFWVHRDKPISPREIWDAWPQSMKEVYLYFFNKYKIKNFCNTFDYDTSYY